MVKILPGMIYDLCNHMDSKATKIEQGVSSTTKIITVRQIKDLRFYIVVVVMEGTEVVVMEGTEVVTDKIIMMLGIAKIINAKAIGTKDIKT